MKKYFHYDKISIILSFPTKVTYSNMIKLNRFNYQTFVSHIHTFFHQAHLPDLWCLCSLLKEVKSTPMSGTEYEYCIISFCFFLHYIHLYTRFYTSGEQWIFTKGPHESRREPLQQADLNSAHEFYLFISLLVQSTTTVPISHVASWGN